MALICVVHTAAHMDVSQTSSQKQGFMEMQQEMVQLSNTFTEAAAECKTQQKELPVNRLGGGY